jgi:hypothetical protein
MEFQRHQSHCLSERKGQKRKLDQDFPDERQISAPPPTADERASLLTEVVNQVNILDSTFTWNESDRAAAKRATHALADLAKNGNSMSPISLELLWRCRVSYSVYLFIALSHEIESTFGCDCRGSGERDC